MAVLSAKGKSISTKKSSSSSKASSIGSVVSGNWGVGSTYSNTGNTVADKAVRESTGQSAQSSANDIQAAKTAGTHVSQTTDRLSTTAQPNTQPQPTAQDKATVDWNNMTLAQQKLYAKINPQVDLAAKWREFAKSNASKIATQNGASNGATSGKNDAWLWQKPQAQQQEAPQVPDYQDNSAERMAEISANLEAAYQQTPNLFKNRDLYDAEFEYDKRSKSQKRALDEFFNRKTQEAVLKSISANDIVNSIASGKTSIEKYGALETIDPIKYQAVLDGIQVANNRKKADSNLAVNNATLQSADGKSTELTVPKELTENNAAIEAAINSNADEYKAAVNDPDLMAKRDELTEEMWYVDQLDKDIMRVKDEVAAQYPWVPRSQLNAIIADRTDKYRIERGDALIKINTLQGIINNRLEEAQLNYNVENNRTSQLMSLESQKLAQLGFAFQVQQYNEAPARAKELALFNQDLQQENAVFETDLQLNANQAKMEQEYNFLNPDIDSTDPATQQRALNMSLDRFYEDYGSIINRSKAQVVSDIKKYAAEKWISLSQAMQENFVTPLKEKPDFQKLLNTKLGVSNDKHFQWVQTWVNEFGQPTFGIFDPSSGSMSSQWGWNGLPSNNSNSPTPSGKFAPVIQNWKPTKRMLDEVAAEPFSAALAELEALGIETVLWSEKEGFTRSNETQAHLYEKYKNGTWGLAAAPWTSKHELGLWADIYSGYKNWKYLAPSQKQIDIMAKHGWTHMWLQWDMGHFEYTGWGTESENPWFDVDKAPQYINYVEKWKLPTGMKDWSRQAQQFIAEATAGYIDAKSKSMEAKWFKITDADAYINTDIATREAIDKAILTVPAFEDTMNELIKLVKDQWTELPLSTNWARMNQLVVDAQLQAKELYNLGVLNWPDYELMQKVIKNPATVKARLLSPIPWIDYLQMLKNGKETVLDNVYEKTKVAWLTRIEDPEWGGWDEDFYLHLKQKYWKGNDLQSNLNPPTW